MNNHFTVKELKEILKKIPNNALIVVGGEIMTGVSLETGKMTTSSLTKIVELSDCTISNLTV